MIEPNITVNHILKTVVLTLLFMLAACAETGPPELPETDRQSIENFYRQWFGSMESEDTDRFLSLLADDFYLKSPSQPAITDTAVLRSGLRDYHRNYRSIVDWSIDEIRIFSGHALVRVSESVALINPQNDDTTHFSGVHLALLRRAGPEGWKLQTDVSSLNHPIQ